MSSLAVALIVVVGLFVCVIAGVHIGFSLALMSVLGIVLMSGNIDSGLYILGTTSFEALRSYSFAVIPLFMLMGAFMSNSNIAKDLFAFLEKILKKIPGGLGVATVLANAVFAAITGVAIASAAIFAKISVPEMERHHYKPQWAAGCVAGSSTLGMLIPPSLMFILYGMLAEVSIGKMFIAGILPGILLAVMFSVLVLGYAIFKPEKMFEAGYYKRSKKDIENKLDEKIEAAGGIEEESFAKVCISVIPTILLIILVLGGIWGGFFTPTEAAGVGALGALIIGFLSGMNLSGLKNALLETASSASSILFLLIAATMYSRMLAMSGAVVWLSDVVMGLNANRYLILALLMVVIIILGCVLDSTSIMLITVPMMAPLIADMGFDLIWFGIVIVLFVHMGLITPPFGMCVFSVKGALPKKYEGVKVEGMFVAVIPFLITMLIHAIIIVIFPFLSLVLTAGM